MKNCSNCKHKRSMFTGLMGNNDSLVGYMFVRNTNSVCEDMYVKCENGHNDECLRWWLENSGKVLSETNDLDCHEHTESVKMLQGMIDLTDKMLDKLKNE